MKKNQENKSMTKRRNKIKQWKTRNLLSLLLIIILLLLTLSLKWGIENFGNIGMEQIIFTLNMPLDGSSSDFTNDYMKKVLIPIIVLFLYALFDILRRKKYQYYVMFGETKIQVYPIKVHIPILTIISITWLGALLGIANQNFNFFDYVKNQIAQSSFIEENYVNPNDIEITFPEQKRNLIYILLESGETSMQDKESGGLFDINYIPEMTQIAQENISFSQSDKIEGAAVGPASGWTVAGMVAQFSGLPLKLFKYDDSSTDNSMGLYQQFLPGITNLGDILEEAGYENYFMIGSDIKFSGRDKLMKQHGNYHIWDYYTAIEKGKITADDYVWWGYEDYRLYEYAKEELARISANNTPFNFTMLTVDTHHIGGYVCPLCQDTYEDQYGNVWACASRQLNDFINWIKEQPFYDNTTIVICGDHCSMDPNFYQDFKYDKHHGEITRKVYNAIINPAVEPIQEKNRKFITMDMFPTTLAAIGVKIEGDRLALGTNLFSKEKTLSELYGYEKIFEELNLKSSYYNENFLYAK